MTIGAGGTVVGTATVSGGGASSRSNSRTKTSSRFSNSKIRHGGSSGGAGSSSAGGHPFAGGDPNATKKEIKQRFEITKKLGSGTYGKVSLAYDHKFDREVAVKLIKKSAIENKQDLVRIRREIRIMSALNHPNIIQIFEVFENKDKIILVMEYASGGELYDYVSKNGSLPEAEARRIFRQITSAVLYCHKHKVAHRDLKLENILLDANNNAKIADFGLSNYFTEKVLLTTFCGSPLYASPEIINGTPYKGPEVDCWSLGILLYTLVYGSMPFDGRDFNRMVRQIKRGAYYEPDTPSTASMLIRNMLRVNPERRADIDDIASHWWLNLEENMPVIQELPENQITDHTPLPERAETMVVQDLADETDVFMEFGHLSSETRKKIEEFRRRRKEAEEYNENSPIKPPKARKLDDKSAPEMTSKEKSLRHEEIIKPPPLDLTGESKKNEFSDPLERLRQLENRLQGNRAGSGSPGRQTPIEKRPGTPTKPGTPTTPKSSRLSNFPLPAQPASPQVQQKMKAMEQCDEPSTSSTKKPYFTSAAEPSKPSSSLLKPSPANNWRLEIDSLSLLMNQVLEQMEKGPVSMNLVARVKAHPFYDQRPMVKELLESIIAAQPKSVQKQASKIIQQQSQDIVRRQISNHNIAADKKLPDVVPSSPKSPPHPAPPTIGGRISNNTAAVALKSKYQVQELPTKVDVKAIHKPLLEERPWHSVEVGFETDEDSSENQEQAPKTKTDLPKPLPVTREVKSDGEIDDEEDEDEEDEEEYESDIDELAEVVEQVAKSTTNAVPQAPKIIENLSKDSPKRETQPDPAAISANHLSTFDRGLAKRQSKGKYQHNHVELYGRGVSTEAESPPPSKRRIGGPQPTPDQSPVLFDKAKKYIMKYPEKMEDSDEEKKKSAAKKKKDWLKSRDPDVGDKGGTTTPSRRGSEPPRDPPTIKSDAEDDESEYEDEESEEESEEEEEEGEVVIQQHRTSIIGYRTITPAGPDGLKKAAPIVPVRPQASTTPPAVPAAASAKPYSSPAMNGTARPSSKEAPKRVSQLVHSSKEPIPAIPTTTTTPATPVTTATTTTATDYGGIQKWESAAAYIRRKNRERRLRNRTIGTPDEVISRPPEPEEPVPPKKKEEEPKLATQASPITGYTRPSYLDERKMNEYRPHNTYIDRRKSFHEMSPGLEEDRHSPGYSYDRQPRYGATGTRYEDESLDSWMNSRNRFEVYQTRAERAAEMNTGGYSYRPTAGSYWHNDRPTSAYIPGSYKSRFDDNFLYRRSAFDVERPVTPGTDYSAPSATGYSAASTAGYSVPSTTGYTTPSTTSYYPQTSSMLSDSSSTTSIEPFLSRFRPVTRRIGSALRDSDARKARARSQSTERKLSLKDENDQAFNPRLMTPEIGSLAGSERSDYSYINYHDTASGRISQPREPDVSMTPARGILKNKQATDLEPRATSVKGDSGVKQIFGRLRRHLSHEKSPSPLHSYRYGSLGPSSYNPVNYEEAGRGRTPSGTTADYESASKKRGFLNMNRRRTTEVRMGPDGKIITNGYGGGEEDYKRPRSPIDRIKSLFRKSKDNLSTAPGSTVPSTYHSYNPAGPNSASSRFSTTDKIFGSYPSSTQSTSHQFKRYTGGKTATNFATPTRYSNYAPSVNTRHWYEDSHLY